MAEKAIEKVDEQLNCSICLDTYTNPSASMSTARSAWSSWLFETSRDSSPSPSPFVVRSHPFQPVEQQASSQLSTSTLLEILDQHKKVKAKSAIAEKADSKGESLSPQSNCSEHGGREVELFCEICQELVLLTVASITATGSRSCPTRASN